MSSVLSTILFFVLYLSRIESIANKENKDMTIVSVLNEKLPILGVSDITIAIITIAIGNIDSSINDTILFSIISLPS